jgi:short-subunit dehydrogenase
VSPSLLIKYGPWALVTGASSGLGAEFCSQLAGEGFNLVMTARRSERLKRLAETLETTCCIQTRIVQADLSTLEFLPSLLEKTSDLNIGLLVNNAGFASIRHFMELDLEREVEMLHVNCQAQMGLAYAFGQKMCKQKQGGIIFVSSVAGLSYSPPWSSYSASKAYVLALAECLWLDLKRYGVDVEALCPGRADTEFLSVAEINLKKASWLARIFLAGTSPEQVVRDGLRGLSHRRVVIPGFQNQVAALATSILPRKWIMRLTASIMESVHPDQ